VLGAGVFFSGSSRFFFCEIGVEGVLFGVEDGDETDVEGLDTFLK